MLREQKKYFAFKAGETGVALIDFLALSEKT